MPIQPTLHPGVDDLPALVGLLAEAGLPHADLADHLGNFVVAHVAGELVGAGGFERCEEGCGLLRSFVVQPDWRGRGLGQRIFAEVLVQARQAGLRDLYLLTGTAGDWFAARGFRVCSREAAPASVRATRQFRELCPASGSFMHRSLDADLA